LIWGLVVNSTRHDSCQSDRCFYESCMSNFFETCTATCLPRAVADLAAASFRGSWSPRPSLHEAQVRRLPSAHTRVPRPHEAASEFGSRSLCLERFTNQSTPFFLPPSPIHRRSYLSSLHKTSKWNPPRSPSSSSRSPASSAVPVRPPSRTTTILHRLPRETV
jgi:hypothetical protein